MHIAVFFRSTGKGDRLQEIQTIPTRDAQIHFCCSVVVVGVFEITGGISCKVQWPQQIVTAKEVEKETFECIP